MAEKPEEKPTQELTVKRKLIEEPRLEGDPYKVYRVTYYSRRIPPRTIWIPADKWSKEAEVEAIRKDIKAHEEEPKETITV